MGEILPVARPIRVEYSEEDKQWVATIRDFPLLSWLADTPSEAQAGLQALIIRVRAPHRRGYGGVSGPRQSRQRRYGA